MPLQWIVCIFVLLTFRPIFAEEEVPLRCGSNCLYVAAGILDKAPASLEAVEEILGEPERNGYSLQRLAEGAKKIGLEAIPVRTSIGNLIARRERFVCIAHLSKGHFVILADVADQSVQVIDPPTNSILPIQTVANLWDGTALLVSLAPLLSEEELSQRLRIAAMGKAAACFIGLVSVAGAGWIFVRRHRRMISIGCLCMFIFLGVPVGCHQSDSVSEERSSPQEEIGPQIVFDSHLVDFGMLELTIGSDRHRSAIRVRNSGTAPLILGSIKLSCGCLSALPRQSVLSPGEETEIDIEVSIQQPGEHAGSLEVSSNCAKTPVERLSLRWNAAGPFELDFPEIDLGRLRPNAVEKRRVQFLSRKATCPDVVFGSFQSKSLNPQLESSIDDGGGSFTVQVTAGTLPESHHEVLVLNLSNCWQDVVRVPVRWEVSPPVSVTPKAFFLGSLARNERVQRKLVVEVPENRVDIDVSDLTTDLTRFVSMNRLRETALIVTIEFTAPENPGPFEAEIDLNVTTPELCDLRIPVCGLVENAKPPTE
ncbi:MAG: DUF1573 domain-containing protein [Planctomycetota bacterium]